MTKSMTLFIALVVLSTLLVFMPDQTEASYCSQLCLKSGFPHGNQIRARCLCYHKMGHYKRDTASATVEVSESEDIAVSEHPY